MIKNMSRLRRRTPANTAVKPVDPENMTIAKCLEVILGSVTDNCIPFVNEENGEEAAYVPDAEYDFVTEKLEITRAQAEMLAAVLEISISGKATVSNLADKLGITNLAFLTRQDDIDALLEKRYVRSTTCHMNEVCYYVPGSVVSSLRRNEKPTHEEYESFSLETMVRMWNKLFSSFWRRDDNTESLFRDVLDIVRFNKLSGFKRAWEAHGMDNYSTENQVFFLYMVTRYICYSDNSFEWNDYQRIFEDDIEEFFIKDQIQEGEHEFFKAGLIEHGSNDGLVDDSTIRLTDSCVKEFIGKENMKGSEATDSANIVKKDTITAKSLFYNRDEGAQIERLTSLLQKENFDNVVSRLEQKGMRKGFCALLYGGPGTGKTETVYQIARQTGRDIYLVDVSQLKSKWVGDSEKNIRALFNEYKSLVRNREIAPILLFNEADAIFGVRMEGATRAVDKMENSIQNIILQEMESLEGIMIATTNLTSNFDPAFERRFIFKVNLSKPSADARAHIWESLVEGLAEEDAKVLASEYDFSGGQIENISRMMTVDFILSGQEPELDSIRRMCQNETISSSKKKERARIGF